MRSVLRGDALSPLLGDAQGQITPVLERVRYMTRLVCRADGGVLPQATLRVAEGRIWPHAKGLDTPALEKQNFFLSVILVVQHIWGVTYAWLRNVELWLNCTEVPEIT